MSAAAVAREVMSEHPGVFFEVSDITHPITIATIMVPREKRNQGIGGRAMQAMCDYADSVHSRILLTPDDCFGTPKSVLVQWYERFGFRLVNVEMMARSPQTPTSSLARDRLTVSSISNE